MVITVLYNLVNILGLLALISLCYEDEIHMFFFLRIKAIPKCKELISVRGAKFPCALSKLSTNISPYRNPKYLSNKKAYVYIKDQSFVFISTSNKDTYIEIPFKSIIYHNSSLFELSAKHSYRIELFFCMSDTIESVTLDTLTYNHNICKKYPDLLCDDQLFDFVCEHFPSKKEYERQRKLERNNQSSII